MDALNGFINIKVGSKLIYSCEKGIFTANKNIKVSDLSLEYEETSIYADNSTYYCKSTQDNNVMRDL